MSSATTPYRKALAELGDDDHPHRTELCRFLREMSEEMFHADGELPYVQARAAVIGDED